MAANRKESVLKESTKNLLKIALVAALIALLIVSSRGVLKRARLSRMGDFIPFYPEGIPMSIPIENRNKLMNLKAWISGIILLEEAIV